MSMNLRPYQQNLINKSRLEFKRKRQRILLVAPTGSGKTVTAAEFARLILAKGGTVYFVVHRGELLRQAEQTFERWGIQGVKCFMVQGLANRIAQHAEPTVLIFDEAHHATAKTYHKIIEYYKNSYILGLTATPCRMSGKPLGDLFQALVQDITAAELIKHGFLSDYDYYCPKLETDYSGLKTQAGDLKAADCFNVMNRPKIYGNIIEQYTKHCTGRRTIIYATTIEHSRLVVEQFQAAGFAAVHLDGNTPEAERLQIDVDFKAGKYEILSNVGLLGEGYDVPDCDCVLLLRRTLSLSLFIQMSTRCLRPQDGKRAIILDFTGSVFIHGLPTIDRDWNLSAEIKTTNINAEPDIKARQCGKCLRTYAGLSAVCPYCGTVQPKTRREIEQDEKAELERITAVQKQDYKAQLKEAGKSLEGLIQYGKLKGYEAGWAYKRFLILKKYKK